MHKRRVEKENNVSVETVEPPQTSEECAQILARLILEYYVDCIERGVDPEVRLGVEPWESPKPSGEKQVW